MYSEGELDSAVASGTLTAEAAAALRAHVAAQRNVSLADEEQFRLVTGFNDIFVTIAGALVLVGAGWFGGALRPSLGGLAVAGAAWAMAEYFTKKRHMALPSIVFFLAFVAGAYATCLLAVGGEPLSSFWLAAAAQSRSFLLSQALASAIVVAACWLHWRRFMVPITIAVGIAAIARFLFVAISWIAYPHFGQWQLFLVLAGGIAFFAYAMHWDMQDRERRTRKSDVAFWLHLAASPMIVHPLFVLMGVNVIGRDEAGAGVAAVLAIVLYVLLAIVALIVDRRAVLVSALAYVLAAAIYLISRVGTSGSGFAVAIVFIGASLLMLSAFWQPMRRALIDRLPADLRSRLPISPPRAS